MELIIAVIIIIGTTIVFCKAINEISTTPITSTLASEYFGTGTRRLEEDFIMEDALEEMSKKVNSKDSKFGVSLKSLKGGVCRFTCVIFILFVSLSFTGCNNSKFNTVTTKIDSLEWRATAEIQQWKSCDESGWEVPEGAIVYKEQEEIKSYKIVGYETKYRVEEYQELVGYIPRIWRPIYETRTRRVPYQEAIKEPVYATKYYYTIDRWVHLKYVLLACGYDQDYNYPDYVCAENERVHNVEYEYLVKLGCDDSHVSHIVDRDTWKSLHVGQEISGEKNQYGHIQVNWDNINTTNE